MFTHIDERNNPSMVDVSAKNITTREAIARAKMTLPAEVMNEFDGKDISTKKGAVFQTAIIAGTMGAKATSSFIPMCHPLPLEKCSIKIDIISKREISITCTAKTSSKTGVEMEALSGATIAALTVYDMCKAFSHDMTIDDVRLVNKTGGKSDFLYTKDVEIKGLVLVGGKSSRMGKDKYALDMGNNKTQLEYLNSLLSEKLDTYISTNSTQNIDSDKRVDDVILDAGALGGIISSMKALEDKALLVVACDMPNIDSSMIEKLITEFRKRENKIVCFESDRGVEPLCAIYPPHVLKSLMKFYVEGEYKIGKIIKDLDAFVIEKSENLTNINTQDELKSLK